MNEFVIGRGYKYGKGWTLEEGNCCILFSTGEEWLVDCLLFVVCILEKPCEQLGRIHLVV